MTMLVTAVHVDASKGAPIRFSHSSNGGHFGEAGRPLSMTILRIAAECGREAIID
jgi:hypothetical protein